LSEQDPTLDRIHHGFRLFCRGERAEGRQILLEMWEQLDAKKDVFHRCVAAHYLADTEDDVQAELEWDRKALAEAESIGEDRSHPSVAAVRAFYPSLHLNLADDFRRLGDFERARHHVDQGSGYVEHLGIDAYGQTVRSALLRVDAQISERDSGPPVIFDFD
jgi:hypothetical protein